MQISTLQKCSSNVLPQSENDNSSRQSTRRNANSGTGKDILPPKCIFCQKNKYKSRERTREKLKSVAELRTDFSLRESAFRHIEKNTLHKQIAENILIILSKDLVSSEAK